MGRGSDAKNPAWSARWAYHALMRVRQLVATAILGVAAPCLLAQTTLPAKFDVVSIKRITGRPGPNIPSSPDTFRRAVTVRSLVSAAYSVPDFKLFGGPNWTREVWFDVHARAEGPAWRLAMLQQLLEDRFKLVVRREQREMRHFALVVAR